MQEIFNAVGYGWISNLQVLLVGFVVVVVLYVAYRNVMKALDGNGGYGNLSEKEKDDLDQGKY